MLCIQMTFTFALFSLHEFSNITQIMKVVLQYMHVHQLPVIHFTSIMAALGMTPRQYFF